MAIVGGGVAALRIAAGLGHAGAAPLVLGPDGALGSMHDARDIGLVTRGLAEHPHRLAAAIGDEGARDLHRWTQTGAAAARMLIAPCPVVRASAGEGEDADIAADLDAAATLGFAAAPLCPDEVAEQLGTKAFGRGWVGRGGVVEPAHALAELAREAVEAGAILRGGCAVETLEGRPSGTRLHTARGAVDADVVVLAGDWRMRDIDPWCTDKVGPVRHHLARYAPPADTHPGPVVMSSQHGWLRSRTDRDGSLTIAGARWASPHFDVGETDRTPAPPIADALHRLVAQRLPRWHAAGRTHSWTTIAAHTCDQLPIVGPLPGRSAVVACFGWNGRPWSMAIRAADAVVEGL
ncbi:MAG: FAD-binding oxidoreductase, partial [Myxococcota bacterium]|nr:FAD-binding oxidoreductase [Myxococcota bacterium]